MSKQNKLEKFLWRKKRKLSFTVGLLNKFTFPYHEKSCQKQDNDMALKDYYVNLSFTSVKPHSKSFEDLHRDIWA